MKEEQSCCNKFSVSFFAHDLYDLPSRIFSTSEKVYLRSPRELILITFILPRFSHRLSVSLETRKMSATSFIVNNSGVLLVFIEKVNLVIVVEYFLFISQLLFQPVTKLSEITETASAVEIVM